MSLEIKNRRLQWFGHVLRMPGERITNIALGWTQLGGEREQAKNHLGEDSDEGDERDRSLME